MHILVTDVLSCPRCGPGFGLILLAGDVSARRVRAGTLACPNCREHYPVRDGVADFGAAGAVLELGRDADGRARDARTRDSAAADPGADPGSGSGEGAPDGGGGGEGGAAADAAFRLLALLGIAEPPALVLLGGEVARLGRALALRVEGLEAICVGAAGGVTSGDGVSPLRVGARLPFHSRSLRGVALSGEAAAHWLEEGARVVGRLGRLVLDDAPADAVDRLRATGLRLLAADAGTVVATHG